MIGYHNLCFLFAQVQRLSGMRDRFGGSRSRMDTGDIITVVLCVVGILVALVVYRRMSLRFSGKRKSNSPWAMFHELCRAHGLDRKSRDLLKSVARWQRLNQPARLFLEPERFESANLSPQLQQHAAELLELRSQLFTFELTEPAAKQPASAATPTTTAVESPAPENQRTETIGAAAFAGTTLGS